MPENRAEEIARILADHRGMEAALKEAARQAVLQHALAGNPVATCRDGKVVWIQPAEILARFSKKTG